MIKTNKAREYDNRVKEYIDKNIENAVRAKRELSDVVANKFSGLSVDCYFSFNESRIITKTKKAESWVKVLDANNRLKSCLDAVSKTIGIDDKFFITGVCEKVICKDGQDESVTIVIKKTMIRTIDQALTDAGVA